MFLFLGTSNYHTRRTHIQPKKLGNLASQSLHSRGLQPLEFLDGFQVWTFTFCTIINKYKYVNMTYLRMVVSQNGWVDTLNPRVDGSFAAFLCGPCS